MELFQEGNPPELATIIITNVESGADPSQSHPPGTASPHETNNPSSPDPEAGSVPHPQPPNQQHQQILVLPIQTLSQHQQQPQEFGFADLLSL
jgi:hypothetical protein